MNPSHPKTPGLSQRTLRLCSGVLCAASLWAFGSDAEAAPGRPTLAQIPMANLPRSESLPIPAVVDSTSENLPFEVILPPDRPKEQVGKGYKKRVNPVDGYGTYQHWLTLKAKTPGICLRANGASASRVEDRDQLDFHNYTGYADQVAAVRAERLELENDGPTLLVQDYFVSPRAGHARHESTTRVPLVKVAEVNSGLTLYAFREPHGLNLVLSAPGAAMIMPNASALSLGCGVARVALDTAGRSGVATSFALGLPEAVEPESVDDFRAYGQIPMQRAWRVSVSVSQTSRDPAPVLSLTFGAPSRPVETALRDRMPRWNEVLGAEKANELEQRLAKRD